MKAMTRNGPFWLREEPLKIRVFGEPQPFPKKEIGIIGTRTVIIDHDYRERQVIDPITKNPMLNKKGNVKKKKYDRGYKRKWMQFVKDVVSLELRKHDLGPFPKNHPVAIGCLFFLSQSKSNKLLLPSQDPDYDNVLYAIMNALKRKPKKGGRSSDCPLGTLFYEDNQPVWGLKPYGKVWATEEHPPGLLITVQDAMYLLDEIAVYQPSLREERS